MPVTFATLEARIFLTRVVNTQKLSAVMIAAYTGSVRQARVALSTRPSRIGVMVCADMLAA